MKKANKLIAVLLMLVFTTPLFPMQAFATDPGSNGVGVAGYGGFEGGGYILTLTALPAVEPAATSTLEKTIDESWLKLRPLDGVIGPAFPINILIMRKDPEDASVAAANNYLATSSGGYEGKASPTGDSTPIPFSKIYDAPVSGTTTIQEFRYTQLKKLYDENKLTIESWEATVGLSEADWSGPLSTFIKMFGAPENIETAVQAFYNGKDPAIAYLDILSMVAAIAGTDTTRKHIETYLENFNSDGSSEYVFIQITNVCYKKDPQGNNCWLTYPLWYTLKFPSSYTQLFWNVPEGWNMDYRANPSAYKKALFDSFSATLKSKGITKSLPAYRSDNVIWSTQMLDSDANSINGGKGYDYMYTVMPTDKDGKLTGNAGYTQLAHKGSKKIENIIADIHLRADPKGKEVKKGDTDTANLTVSLKQVRGAAKTKLYAKYEDTPEATLTLRFTSKVEKGSVSQGNIVDSSTQGTLAGTTLTVPFNKAIAMEHFEGRQKINVLDTGVTINATSEVRYSVEGEITFSDGVKATLNSVGVSGMGTKTASDVASWIAVEEIIKYYSAPEAPYVEIKHNDPRSEVFEAMAGVPTTEDLYVGFGGTEFIINEELKYKTQTATRKWTATYNASGCIEGDNIKCVTYCGSSSPTHECPGTPNSCANGMGAGCKTDHYVNRGHPHAHTITATIDSPIDTFAYMDIDHLELWQTNRLILEGNKKLFSNNNQTIDPEIGFDSLFMIDAYASNNGRLNFSYSFDDKTQWGNAEIEQSGGGGLITDVDKAATEWFNSLITGKTVNATAISDYVVLGTTEGHQIPMFYEYESNTVPVTASKWSTNLSGGSYEMGKDGTDAKSPLTGSTITWPKVPKKEDMWDNNPLTAKTWDQYHITRSGYNGNFSNPAGKWSNVNSTTPTNPAKKWLDKGQPSVARDAFSTAFVKNADNLRMTYKGLNIIDSTDDNRNWSASDGITPVSNGEWDTGKCRLEMDKVITFNNPNGVDWGQIYKVDVPYTNGQDKVNNIVVHNPVSNSDAIIICNDEQYDLRTDESLALGGDPPKPEQAGCPLDDTCMNSFLNCKVTPSAHGSSCYMNVQSSFIHSGGMNAHTHIPGACYHSHAASGCTQQQGSCACDHCGNPACAGYCSNHMNPCNPSGCTGTGVSSWSCGLSEGQVVTETKWYNNGHPLTNPVWWNGTPGHIDGVFYCDLGDAHGSAGCNTAGFDQRTTSSCNGALNKHNCTPECKSSYTQILACNDPHHFAPGAPHNPNASTSHYPFPDGRCYQYCGNDAKHKTPDSVQIPGGGTASSSDTFINLDRDFILYYPEIGDFAQQPNMHGIANTTHIRGKGYEDRMDTTTWLRDKYATFPVNVIDELGEQHAANSPIDLLHISDNVPGHDAKTYKFYSVLANHEQVNATVDYLSIGNNAAEVDMYTENNNYDNSYRSSLGKAAKHTAWKTQTIDVLGYIGNLTMHDTGDFRFATLFKKQKNDGTWYIENLVPRVDLRVPNSVLADNIDIRQEPIDKPDKHNTFGQQDQPTGGKAGDHVSLPLTPNKNPIVALRNQPIRPGYNLYMDIETAGNYYGENYDDVYNNLDDDMWYKTQVTPRYYELNKDTGQYTPVDIYMGKGGEYEPVWYFDSGNGKTPKEYVLYMDWAEESGRRNYTKDERDTSQEVMDAFYDFYIPQPGDGSMSETPPVEWHRRIRLPISTPDPIGTPTRLFLNDLNRTFIGSEYTYGVNQNPHDEFDTDFYKRQSQRWQFTLGLPSSTVFVTAGLPCTEENIKQFQSRNSVVVQTIDIKSRGTVWTLEYDGTSINMSDGGGFRIEEGGKVYPPPIDPATGKPTTDPIIAIYDNKKTSKDDLRTEGSH